MDVSLNQRTYENFKRDILTLSFKPGEPVSANRIAERYNVSRTPAREALVRLQDEGMVDIYPQSGSVVSKIKKERILQEWFVRRSLELGMIDSFFDRVCENDITEMKETLKQMEKIGNKPRTHESAYEYICSDDRFHGIMYRAAGEKLASRIIENMLPNYRRMRLLVDLDDVNMNRTVGEHRQLIKLASERRREEYREFLTGHLGHIVRDIELLRENFPDMFDGEEQ